MAKKFKDIRNIQEAWRKYKVLIYSPTIMAGVSFEMKHFDVLFGYYQPGFNSVENFMQMLGRVRNLSSTTYHLHYRDSESVSMLVTTQDIDTNIKYTVYRSCESLPKGVSVRMTDTEV